MGSYNTCLSFNIKYNSIISDDPLILLALKVTKGFIGEAVTNTKYLFVRAHLTN